MADSIDPDHPQPPERPYPGDKQPNVPDEHRRVFRTQKPASLMVWAALVPAGQSPLVFAPEAQKKINQKTYIETILELALKPGALRRQSLDI